jgi:hypothetical protein
MDENDDAICHGLDGIHDETRRQQRAWQIEKNGYRSPLDARAAWLDANLRRVP